MLNKKSEFYSIIDNPSFFIAHLLSKFVSITVENCFDFDIFLLCKRTL